MQISPFVWEVAWDARWRMSRRAVGVSITKARGKRRNGRGKGHGHFPTSLAEGSPIALTPPRLNPPLRRSLPLNPVLFPCLPVTGFPGNASFLAFLSLRYFVLPPQSSLRMQTPLPTCAVLFCKSAWMFYPRWRYLCDNYVNTTATVHNNMNYRNRIRMRYLVISSGKCSLTPRSPVRHLDDF